MKRIFLFFLLIVSAFFLVHICCERDFSTLPMKKNPRELSWSIDTLAYPGYNQTAMDDIWGSSATNVYVVGHNSDIGGKMYHFDGKRWADVKLSAMQGGNIVGAFQLAAIYGFGPGDIWAVGDYDRLNPNPPPYYIEHYSLVIHYNGKEWQQIKTPEGLAIHFDGSQWNVVNVPKESELFSVWGISPDDIWMGGLDGTLFHFDGTSVKKDSVPVSISEEVYRDYFFSEITGISSDEVYMLLTAWGNSSVPRRYLLGRQADSWVVVDSTFFPELGLLWMSPSGTLYTAEWDNVYKRQGNSWIDIADETLKRSISVGDIGGTDDNNIFVVGASGFEVDYGEAYHYNGVNWYHLEDVRIANASFNDVEVIDGEVFIVGTTTSGFPEKTLILHGK